MDEQQQHAVAMSVAGETISIQQLQAQQHEQAMIIQSMQATIANLSNRQVQLEEEIACLQGGQWIVKPKRTKTGRLPSKQQEVETETLLTVGGGLGVNNYADAEIDRIIEARKQRKAWPLKRKYCPAFSQEVDLVKIRCHKTPKHHHNAIRIPKVEKSEDSPNGIGNKEGRLICRLCSGKTCNRNTSWMCATCLVPLCVDIVNGDSESSCHARWHGCQDLVAVNEQLNATLRERRELKKRSKMEGDQALGALGVAPVAPPPMAEEAAAAVEEVPASLGSAHV